LSGFYRKETNMKLIKIVHKFSGFVMKYSFYGGLLPFILFLNTFFLSQPVFCQESWSPTSTGSNVPSARWYQTAIWTGSNMIIWGGFNNGNLNTGGIYDPSTNSWTPTSMTNVPSGRRYHTAVWTGTQMIIWGGEGTSPFLNTGGIYDTLTNSWTATSTTNAPSPRIDHSAVWTGNTMIIWGGWTSNYGHEKTGGIYNPSTDSWTSTDTTNAPFGRYYHTAVWTGSKMIVWGGAYISGIMKYLNTGGVYDPSTNSWTPTSMTNVPSARYYHTAIWTGSKMIIWGGNGNNGYDNTGGIYDPSTDTWSAISTYNAPSERELHTAVWTENDMVIWGGISSSGFLNTGGIYYPFTDTWTTTTTINAPSKRYYHTAVWTGSQMIVWGGSNGYNLLNTGGIYTNPILTGITNNGTNISFSSLSQNYPNPFNLSTRIDYQLPINEYVKLSVFDINGREIAVLVNDNMETGSHEVNWDASNYPDGVYFYKLVAGTTVQVKNMILFK